MKEEEGEGGSQVAYVVLLGKAASLPGAERGDIKKQKKNVFLMFFLYCLTLENGAIRLSQHVSK